MRLKNTDRLLRINQVLEIIPVGKSTLWKWVKDGYFPAPTKLSDRVSCWPESCVRAFIAAQTKEQGGDAHV